MEHLPDIDPKHAQLTDTLGDLKLAVCFQKTIPHRLRLDLVHQYIGGALAGVSNLFQDFSYLISIDIVS